LSASQDAGPSPDSSIDAPGPTASGLPDTGGEAIDASLFEPSDAATTPPLPAFCDGGLFVEVSVEVSGEVSGDAGTKLLTGSCFDAGPPVPVLAPYMPGEDCLGNELRACQGPASFGLFSGCTGCFSGSCPMMATYADGDGGAYGSVDDSGWYPVRWGSAQIDISARPWDGGVVGGTYVSTFGGVTDDAGVVPIKTFTGRFCVLAY
jgi:hypothetical protein